jgi:hypothetical protein
MNKTFAALLIWVMSFAASSGLLTGQGKANDDVKSVISSQIDAFLQDDFVTAFDFASPFIRNFFRTPENFGQMVRNGYPMVWRPSDVEFLSTDQRDGALIQNVMIRDANGALFLLEYEMIETESGWLINGVRVQEAGDGMA